jgi:hypothetical protein
MITADKVERVMNSSIGSMTFFKRDYGKYMDYTEGVMNVQRELNMFWFVDLMYSHISKVVDNYCITEDHFYLVRLDVNDDNTAYFSITREVYDEDIEDYKDEIVAEQEIEYTDLPKCTMKFYLELANYEPLTFRLLCPSEH